MSNSLDNASHPQFDLGGGLRGGVIPVSGGRWQITAPASMTYEGAMRVKYNVTTPGLNQGARSSAGMIAVVPERNSLVATGHVKKGIDLLEWEIPETLSTDLTMSNIPIVQSLKQPASGNLLSGVPGHDGYSQQAIGGMIRMFGTGGDPDWLLVATYDAYDGTNGQLTPTHTVINDVADLDDPSNVGQLIRMDGRRHSIQYLSEIPPEWQSALGGTHIAGASNGPSINASLSIGPSAWVFSPDDVIIGTDVAATAVIDYHFEDLDDDPFALYRFWRHTNSPFNPGDDVIWTALSNCAHAFIIPGTSTYFCFGFSGGADSGQAYGSPPYGGSDGWYPITQGDEYNYYWLFDVNDMVAVKNGEMQPHEVRPYDHAPLLDGFPVPYGESGLLYGGSYDVINERLWLTFYNADALQSGSSRAPLFVALKINLA